MFIHREHTLWVRKLPDDYHPDTSDDPYGAVVVALAKETNGDYSGLVLSRVGVRRRVVYAVRDLNEKDCVKYLVQSEVVTAHTMLPVAPGQNNPWTRDPFSSNGNNGSSSPTSNGQGSSSTNASSGANDDRGDSNKSKELPLVKMRKTSNFAAVRSELVKWEAGDKHSGYKFGILLAKEGQTTEEEMYNGSATTTPLFESFLSILGDRVDLVGYNGYTGGLDTKHGRTGQQSLATCIDDSNVMFHVVSMIPATSSEGIISKKRHIGNDMGVVIFKEGNEKLDVGAFRSQFNHFFIVVKPIVSGDSQQTGSGPSSPARQGPTEVAEKSSDFIVHAKSSGGSSRSLLGSSTSSIGGLTSSGASINASVSNGDSLRTSSPAISIPSSNASHHATPLNLSGITNVNMLTSSGPLSPSAGSTPVYLGSSNFVSAFASSSPQLAITKSAVVHTALQSTTVIAHGKTVSATPTGTPPLKFSIEVVSKKGVPPSPPFLTESPEFELGPYMRQWILTKLLNLERMTQETVPIFRSKLEKVRAMALYDVTLVSNGKKIVDVITPTPVIETPVAPVRRGSVLKKTASIESGMAKAQIRDAAAESNLTSVSTTAPTPHVSSSPPGSHLIHSQSASTPDRARKGSLLSHSAKNLYSSNIASDSSSSSSKIKDKKDKKEKGKRGRSGSLVEDPSKPSSAIKQHGSQGSPSGRHRPEGSPISPRDIQVRDISPASYLSDGDYTSFSAQRKLTSSMDSFRPGIVDPHTKAYSARGGSMQSSTDSVPFSASPDSQLSPRSPRSGSGVRFEPSVNSSSTPPIASSSLVGTSLSTIGESSVSPREPMAPLSPRMLVERSMSPARPTRPAPAREVSPGRSGYTSDSRSPPRQLISSPHTKHSSTPRMAGKATSARTASPVPSEGSHRTHHTEPIAPATHLGASADKGLIDISDWDANEALSNAGAESGHTTHIPSSTASTNSSISSASSTMSSTVSSAASARPARAVPSRSPASSPANAGGQHAAPSRSLSLGVMNPKITSSAQPAANGEKTSATTTVVPAPTARPPAPARPAPSPANLAKDGDNRGAGALLEEDEKLAPPKTVSPILLTPPSGSPPPQLSSSPFDRQFTSPDSSTSSTTKAETASTSSIATLSSPSANAGRRKSATLQRTSSGYDSDKLAASLARQAEQNAEGKNKTPQLAPSETKVAHKAAFNSVKERWAQMQAEPTPSSSTPSPPTGRARLVSARSMSDLRAGRSTIDSSKK